MVLIITSKAQVGHFLGQGRVLAVQSLRRRRHRYASIDCYATSPVTGSLSAAVVQGMHTLLRRREKLRQRR